MAELTPYEKDILVRTVLGEARGEGQLGMEAVANVIRNRAQSGQYPSNPAQVALQPSQFSVWNNGAANAFSPSTPIYGQAAQAIDRVFGGGSSDPTNGALFYHTPAVNPAWSSGVNQYGTTRIGNHIFYNGEPIARTPANPIMASTALSTLRNNTSPSGGNGLLQAALDRYATKEANRVTPASVEDRVTARNKVLPLSSGGNEVTALEKATQRAAIAANPTQIERNTFQPKQAPNPASVEDRVTARNKPTALQSAAQQQAYQAALKDAERRAAIAANPSQIERNVTRSLPTTQQIMKATPFVGGGVTAIERLPSGSAALPPALYGSVGAGAAPVPFTRPSSFGAASKSAPAPLMASAGLQAQRATAVGLPIASLPRAIAPTPAIQSSALAQARTGAGLNIAVNGSNTIVPQSLYYTNPIEFGNKATSQSGDTSVGNQADAAAARASGDAARAAREARR